ncbi:MAG: endolytic transglycosylase MltG [Acidobacteriia bacterium]|nr:endolytic transglycosylase MltG [Terriglobia bacterium]
MAITVLWGLSQPYRGFADPVAVEIPKGMSTRQMAALLAEKGVVRWEWQFLAARALRPRARLQAGEYLFAEPADAREVLDRIARGDVFFYEVRVPEGSNLFDIARLAAGLGFITEDEFLEAAASTGGIQDLAPHAETLEGYLFPSTYRLTRHTSATQLTAMMVEQFRRIWKQLHNGTGMDAHAAVTLASLVEKETALNAERPLVASVYRNRLDMGMKLDCDPTTIYAAMIEKRYRGAIYRSDLSSQNRYNTYQHSGLPPGPIANPGAASLQAALAPAQTRYLYFVAKPGGDGSHQFSETFGQHQSAVGTYKSGNRKAQKTRGAKAVSVRKKSRRP